MKIENYDSVGSFIAADSGAATDKPVELVVRKVATEDGNTVVTVGSTASADLDYRLRFSGTKLKVNVGDKAVVNRAEQTAVFESTSVLPEAPTPKQGRRSGCASYADL